ncbi:hypothetical protein HBH1_04508 [Herbaspirillum sp. BH-1]|nr:hypothetical protein HBH1_04508 [Herbaspirillum sp. BH-1]
MKNALLRWLCNGALSFLSALPPDKISPRPCPMRQGDFNAQSAGIGKFDALRFLNLSAKKSMNALARALWFFLFK